MGQLLSVSPAWPLLDLTSETPKDEVSTTPKETDLEAEQTPQKPTTQEPPLQALIPLGPKKSPKHRWRLIDARAFVHKGVIRLARIDDFRDMDVIAISYTWSEDMRKWREKIVQMGSGRTYEDKILRGSASVSHALASGSFGTANDDSQASVTRAHLFFTVVAFMVYTRGKKFFWMDILCINQEEIEEKKFFVPRMATLYSDTYETHAYPSGAEIAPSITHECVRKPVWETRAWTAQEQILSKRVMFCYLFQGDVEDDIHEVTGHSGRECAGDVAAVDRQLDSPVLDHFRYNRSVYVLRRGEHVVTCHMEAEDPLGNFTANVLQRFFPGNASNTVEQWDTVRETASRSTMYKQIATIRESRRPLVQARWCLETLPMRRSMYPEDMIYSALGIFNMEDYVPEYGIGFEEARLRVFEAMGSTVLAHLLGTDWRSNQGSVHRDTALPRIVGGAPIVGGTDFQSSILECKYDRTTGTKLCCRSEKWRIWKPSRDVLSMTTVTRYVLGNDQLIIVQGSRADCDQRSLVQPSNTNSGLPTRSQSRYVRNVVVHSSSTGISDEEHVEGIQHSEQPVEFPGILVGSRHVLVQASRMARDQRSLVRPSANAEPPFSSQSEHFRNIVIQGSSIGISDEEYFEGSQNFEQIVEFIEVGSCNNVELIAPVGNTAISLMALCTNRLASGNYTNIGAALIADLDAFTSEFVDVVIE